ncbi:PcfJ domain-containing protein [Hymenobacter actinosclerus]|uniref:PcfJ-like protein n=1 Tax=Hymenobacter actinosclerus TaxID=82805 RepID=A0A1I0BTP5_9BACT|nr:PcfJ domain-containing protein [Hymenobacter actinosclerus]SET09782.1 PcfJ-like protein [Hymenobacter actinosclerus]
MANRTKHLTAKALATQQAVAALQNRCLVGRKWSVARQIEFICSCSSVAKVHTCLEPGSPVAQLYFLCLHGRNKAKRQVAKTALRDLAATRTEVLTCLPLLPAVAAICQHYAARRRELSAWKPQRRNAYRQLYDLVHYLFDEYGDVPGWVIEAWATGQLTQQVGMARLTVHLGSGQALRAFRGLPVALTRRLEHEMRQAPYEYTFVQALRYAQLANARALPLLDPVLKSRLGQELVPDDASWLTVAAFFRDAPMTDPWQFEPVCEWIEQCRTVGVDGELPQPGFSLKGRQMASVLRQATSWHQRTHRARTYWGCNLALSSAWVGLPITGFELGGAEGVRIRQLLNYAQLLEEGSAQKHCVSSYVYSCLKGRCGIFSLSVHGARTLTVEVLANRQIVQIRGRENRRATEREQDWLHQWATAAGLSFSANT